MLTDTQYTAVVDLIKLAEAKQVLKLEKELEGTMELVQSFSDQRWN